MKNLIIGISVGLIIGAGGTILIYQSESESVREQDIAAMSGNDLRRPDSLREDNTLLARAADTNAIRTLPEKAGDIPVRPGTERDVAEMSPPTTPGETRGLNIVEDDRIGELLSRWPDTYLSGDTSRINALLDELKEAGKNNTERMIAIFRGSSSLTDRLAAARTLGAINRDLIDPDLREIIKNEVFPFLKKTYRKEASIDVRESCLYAMGEVRTAKSMRFLEEMTENENRQLARAAVYSLGVDGGKEAIEKLTVYWSDTGEGRMRWTAAAGLGDNGNNRTMDQISDIFSDSDNDEEKIMAAYTIGRMNNRLEDDNSENFLGSDVIPFLDGILDGTGDTETRRMAAWALAESGLREADQAIFRILESNEEEDMELKNTAIRALGSSGGGEAAEDCLNLFRYGDDSINRVQAVQVLGHMNTRGLEDVPDSLIRNEVIPFLLSTWDENPSQPVKKEIITGLGLSGGKKEIEFLESISSSNQNLSREIRRATRQIEYRLETGENWSVRFRRRRR
jgi:HEAT repeat protein